MYILYIICTYMYIYIYMSYSTNNDDSIITISISVIDIVVIIIIIIGAQLVTVPQIGSSRMWCLRMRCLIMVALALSYT